MAAMEQLIPVINRLQDVFNTLGGEHIDLPQIAVVGTQSSGKSSVLENIVGKDFLPRGSGIVTRRPLVLQLVNLPPGKNDEWGEFLHKPNEMFTDFSKLREEIDRETDRLTGKNKGISNVPIRLKIFSPHVLNLTLVDLPGITRVPVGDQPPDIEIQIRRMLTTYIEKPNCIILAVTAANTDISTSDALQMAREVDPEGNRTIGVLTKIDIMDRGTDALDVLCGRVAPLKLGYIGVINRSQADINNRKTIRDALKFEAEFFSTHQLYRSIASRNGTPYLTKTLNKILMNHIKNALPDLRSKINKMMVDAQNEMDTYGNPMYDGKNSQGALLLQVISKFAADYCDAIDGKMSEQATNELYGGARINYIFSEVFSHCLERILPSDGLTTNDIRTAIKNATGPRAALFVPEVAFELLVRRQIARLEDPSLECVELVFDELQRIVGQLESKELVRFARLRERVVEVVNNLLAKCRSPTKQMISDLIKIEHAYINTNHPDFVGGGGAISKIFEKMARTQQQDEMQRYQQQQQYVGQNATGSSAGMGGPQSTAQQIQQTANAVSTVAGAVSTVQSGGRGGPSQPGQQPGGPGTGSPAGGPGGQPGQAGFFGKFFGGPPGSAPPGSAPTPVDQKRIPVGQQPPPGARPPQMQSQSMQSQQAPRPMGGGTSADASNRLEQVPVVLKAANPQNDKERFETELIQNLLTSYFDIVRKNISDLVPKAIMHFLVNQSKEKIQHELVQNLYKEELFDELLEENPAVAARRKACREMLDMLRKAVEILNEIRDIAV